MKIKPIGERIVLKQIELEERTKSGIYLPKKEDRKEGEVVEVGTFLDGKPLPLRVGDRVIYSGYSSEEIEVNNEKFLIVEFKDVIAKLEHGGF
jgi:chaperonin GroES